MVVVLVGADDLGVFELATPRGVPDFLRAMHG